MLLSSTSRCNRLYLFVLLPQFALIACSNGNDSSAADAALAIDILSSRPDMVSGGDALIAISTNGMPTPAGLAVTVNGRDVTSRLTADAGGRRLIGLIDGLHIGDNRVRAVTSDQPDAAVALTLTNYPLTGPIVSGAHLSPYECRTVQSGLGEPLDDDCSAERRIEYFYRSTDDSFKPLPAGEPPADLAMTSTIEGVTVPYIVRVDSGTINRSIYRIAILDDGTSSDTPWRPGPGWNGRLAVSFCGGAGTNYHQGSNQAASALSDLYLSRGFAYMIATELVNGLHANAHLQGETLMMLKEYFIERYGVPDWTVGTGGSGGSIQQQLITQIFPGLLDGLQPSASYPDSSLHTADCGLLQHYWDSVLDIAWTDEMIESVSGFSGGTCRAWERSFVPVLTADVGCGLTDESLMYHPDTNPAGARCTVQDLRVNFYGRDPESGFARKPQDNVGLQYGLGALNSGAISVDQFLDLNADIGGNDIDGRFTPDRSAADPRALRAIYEYGFINSGAGGLDEVPIIHYRSYTDLIGDIHDRHRDLTIRARLERANGRSDNQVIWVGPRRARGTQAEVSLAALALDAMTEWLDALVADPAPLSIDKVVKHKPAAAVDACWSEDYQEKIVEPMSFDGDTRCNALYAMHSEPRIVAGAPLTNDIMKCQLKPIDPADYAVPFTDEQRSRLAAIFPEGVCDFSRPGVAQTSPGVVYPQ